MTIGERIKQIRKENGLTLVQFAERIKISFGSVSKLEKGENNPANRTISLICREFGVNEAWLRTGKGEMYAPDVLDDIIKEQGLEGEAAELTKRFARVFASLRPETQHELLTNFDRYFNPPTLLPDAPPKAEPPPDALSRAQEADDVSAKVKEQILSAGEKASESGTPPAGAGTA